MSGLESEIVQSMMPCWRLALSYAWEHIFEESLTHRAQHPRGRTSAIPARSEIVRQVLWSKAAKNIVDLGGEEVVLMGFHERLEEGPENNGGLSLICDAHIAH